MDSDEIILLAEEEMETSYDVLLKEFGTIRTGKASTSLVDNLDVEAYGTNMKLKQLAMISTPEPRLISIEPYDVTTVKNIEKSIMESKIGINPVVNGKIIRLPIPPLTEERRKVLVKTVKQISEEFKIRIRKIRKDSMDELKNLKKKNLVTEDDLKNFLDDIQNLTDDYVSKIDSQTETKEEEIMKI
jgi:ribosome recycling factor